MKSPLPQLLLLTLLALLPAGGLAQTAVWIAPGTVASGSNQLANWDTAGNWDTGVVPNASGAVAIVNQSTNASIFTPVTGGAEPVVLGDITIGEVRFALPPVGTTHFTGLYVGSPYVTLNAPSATGHLRLDGEGVTISAAGTSAITYVDLRVEPGSMLDFVSQAKVTRSGFTVTRLFLDGLAGYPASVRFFDDASPGIGWGQGSITASGPTEWEFHDRSSTNGGFLPLSPNSRMTFLDQASAGNSTIQFLYNGPANDATVRFAGSSTAAQSSISSPTTLIGAVEFIEQATGGTARLSGVRRLDITGASTGTGTTGRMRATTSVLTPVSVVADDARTINLSSVYVQDLLLGSNTLQISSGYIGNIRDSGGAYLSAAGENLVGGGLLKVGTGSLTLGYPSYNPLDPPHPSYNVMSGPTIIRQGELVLYNRIASTTVESAGLLSGIGIVGGNLLNQGRVAPYYWGGPMQVTGNYLQSSGGSLVFNPNSLLYPSSLPQLAISGTATLAGRLETYSHISLFPNRTPGTISQVVLTAGAISGRFDRVGSDYPAARFPITAEYGPTSVTLRFQMLPIAALAVTPAQLALGAYLDRVYQFNGSTFPNNFNGLVDGLNTLAPAESFRRVLDNFAPDRYGSLVESSLAAALARRTVLDRVLTAARESGHQRPAVFVEGGRRQLTFDAVDGLPQAAGTTDGGLAGVTWGQGQWTFGAYVAQETSRLKLDEAGSRAEVKSVEPGIIAQYASNDFFIQAGAGFSRDRHDLRRTVDYVYFGNTIITDSATPSGTRHDYSVTTGWSWRSPGWALTPFAGVMLTRWRIDDFSETNNSYLKHEPMAFSNWSAESRRIRAGFELRGTAPRARFSPRLAVAWWHELETDRTISARFVGEATGYLAPGRPADKDLLQGSLGFDWRLSPHLVFSVNAGLVSGSHARTTSDLGAGFRWEF